MSGADLRVPGGDRVDIVDALRGIAALAVAWFHFTQGSTLLPEGALKSSGEHGWLGVEAFFVISGFVIPLALQGAGYGVRRDFAAFFARRLMRIEPPYVAAIVLSLGAWYLAALSPWFRGTPIDVSPSRVLGHLAYLNAFTGEPWLNPVFWSLAVEFQYYLLIGLAFPVVAHTNPAIRFIAAVGFCALGFAFPDPAHAFHYAPFFCLGIAAFWQRLDRAGEAGFLACLAFFGAFALLRHGAPAAMAGVLCAYLIGRASLRVPRLLRFLGALSFPIYLVHVPVGGRVVQLGTRFADSTALQVAVLAAALAATVLVAWVFHRLIERPAQAWARSVRYGTLPRAPSPA